MNRKSNVDDIDEATYVMSIGDVMSGLLFIFIITAVIFSIDFKNKTEKLAQTNRSLAERESIKIKIMSEIDTRIRARGVDKNLDIVADYEKGVFHLRDNKKNAMFFKPGEAYPEPEGRVVLEELADILSEVVPCYTSKNNRCEHDVKDEEKTLETVFIEGHTDVRPVHSSKYKDNWVLSTYRAISAYEIMKNRQNILDNLKNENLQHVFSVSGYGETRPLSIGSGEESWRSDRRIDLRFIMAQPKPKK